MPILNRLQHVVQSPKTVLIVLTLLGLSLLPGLLKPANAIFGLGPCTRTADFNINADPLFLTVAHGATGSTTITADSINGFAGTVSLTGGTSPPMMSGVTLSFSTTSVSVSAGGSASSTLTVSVPSMGPPFASIPIVVNGTSGGVTHSAEIGVEVVSPTYSISASPSIVELSPGSSAPSTITVTSEFGFTGTVTLSKIDPSGLAPPTATLTPTSVILGTSATSTLTVSADTSVAPGLYSVYVYGNGTFPGASYITIKITRPSFELVANPSDLTIPPSGTGSSTITVKSLHGFSGPVDLTATPSDFSPSLSVPTVTISPSSNGTSTLSLSVPGGTAPGPYSVTVTGSNGTTALDNSTYVSIDIPSTAPDFNITSSPETLTISPGTTGTSAITLRSLNGFTGTVNMSLLCSPGIYATISPTSGSLSSGGTATATMSVEVNAYTHSPPISFFVVVNGTNGSMKRYGGVVVLLGTPPSPDFGISATGPVSFASGSSGTSTVTLASLYGFTGTVTLSTGVPPSTGFTATCGAVTPVTIPPGGTSTAICTFSASTAGSYSVTITGTSGSKTHSATVTVTVTSSYGTTPDFSLSASPTSVSFQNGSSKTTTVTVSGLYGFTGSVALITSVAPSTGLTASCATLSPSPVSAGGTSTASCTFSSSKTGTYIVTITGSSGSLSHYATVSVSVTSVSTTPSQPANTILGLDPTIFYIVIGVIAAGVIGGLLLAWNRMSARSSKAVA